MHEQMRKFSGGKPEKEPKGNARGKNPMVKKMKDVLLHKFIRKTQQS